MRHPYRLIMLLLVAAVPTPARAQQKTLDYQQAVREAVAARRAGTGADEVIAMFVKLNLRENDALAAIREAGYTANEAAVAASRTLRLTADRGVATLLASGYPVSDVARVYQGIAKGSGEIVKGFRDAGVTAAETIASLESVGYARDAIVASVGSVYGLSANALAAQMRAAGHTAIAVAQALRAGGYANTLVGEALRAAGYNAVEIAQAYEAIGVELVETAKELKRLGFEMNEMGDALIEAFGAMGAPLAIALKGSGATATQVAETLRRAGLTAQQSAAALKAAGFAQVVLGSSLITVGYLTMDVAEALAVGGASTLELANMLDAAGVDPVAGAQVLMQLGRPHAEMVVALQQTWARNHQQTAAILHEIGFSASQAFASLQTAFGIGAQLAFEDVLDRWGVSDAMAAAKAGNIALKSAAKWAAEQGIRAAELGAALHAAYAPKPADLVGAMTGLGFVPAEIVAVIDEIHDLTAPALAVAVKPLFATPDAMIAVLMEYTNITQQEAASIVSKLF